MWLVLGLSKAIATVPQTWGPTLLVPNPGLAILWPLFKDSEPMTLPDSIFRPPQMVGRGSRQQAPTHTPSLIQPDLLSTYYVSDTCSIKVHRKRGTWVPQSLRS